MPLLPPVTRALRPFRLKISFMTVFPYRSGGGPGAEPVGIAADALFQAYGGPVAEIPLDRRNVEAALLVVYRIGSGSQIDIGAGQDATDHIGDLGQRQIAAAGHVVGP